MKVSYYLKFNEVTFQEGSGDFTHKSSEDFSEVERGASKNTLHRGKAADRRLHYVHQRHEAKIDCGLQVLATCA